MTEELFLFQKLVLVQKVETAHAETSITTEVETVVLEDVNIN